MKYRLVVITIMIELIVVGFLSFKIYKKQKNILGAFSNNPIEKDAINFNPTDKLTYFYEPKPDTIEKVEEWVPYKNVCTINSDALNERFNYQIEKPDKAFRIITLGDSFTYGLNVDTKDNWPELLEDKLNRELKCSNINKFEVINLGVYGYDIQYSIERFKLRGEKYHPDLVIWFIVDPERIDEKIFEYLPQYKKELFESGELKKLQESGVYYRSWELARNQVIKELGHDGIERYQKSALEEINKYYKKKLVMVLSPWLSPEQKKFFETFSKNRKDALCFSDMINFGNDQTLFFPNDGHPNQKGHQVIAQNVFDYLVKNVIVPCD